MENDTINKTDKHLTNTLKFSLVDDFNTSKNFFGLKKDSYAITINQDTYTPENTQEEDPTKYDLPYAGHLHSSFTYINWDRDKYHSVGVSLGYIGDETQTDEMQNALHKVIGSRRAKGWNHQIDSKTTYQINYNYGEMIYEKTLFKRDIKVSKNYEVSYGNFERIVSVNYQLRSGKNYPTNFSSLTNCKVESLSEKPKTFGFSYGYGLSLIYIDDSYLAEKSSEFRDIVGKVAIQDELSFSLYKKNLKFTFFIRAIELATKDANSRSLLGGLRLIKYNF